MDMSRVVKVSVQEVNGSQEALRNLLYLVSNRTYEQQDIRTMVSYKGQEQISEKWYTFYKTK